MKNKFQKYCEAYNKAIKWLAEDDGFEPTSAFKQAASDAGIQEGQEMADFVEFALENWK